MPSELAHSQFLLAQRIHRLVKQNEEQLDQLNGSQLEDVQRLIIKGDYDGLKQFVESINLDYHSMPIMKLRRLCYLRGIKNSSLLSRGMLISALESKNEEITINETIIPNKNSQNSS